MQAAPTQTGGAPQDALDPTIVNLAKAIRQTETQGQKDPYTAKGASGEYGAYQYTKGTWDKDVLAFTGKKVALEDADKILQNEVAYKKLESLKKQGYNVGQIASIWNSGSPEWEGKTGVNKYNVKYDVPKYVNAVADAYQAFKAGGEPTPQDTASTVGKEQRVSPQEQADQESAQQTGAFFPAVTGDSPITAGLKAAGNMIPSAFNFAKNALQTINPVQIVKNLASIPGEVSGLVHDAGGVGKAVGAFSSELPGTTYRALVPEAARDVIAGDIEGAARSVTNDPFGQVAPLVFGAKGLAKGVDAATAAASKARTASYVENIAENTKKGVPLPKDISTNFEGAVDSGISKTAQVVTKPVSYAFGKAADVARGGPKLTAEDYAGEILQGDTAMRSTGAKVLSKLDIKGPRGVQTYDDLVQRIGSAIEENQAKVDAEYAVDKTPRKLSEFTQRSKGIAPINYVQEALKGLQEFYTKSRDVNGMAWSKNMTSRAKTTGLTPEDINIIAKKYGGEFGKKAFSKVTNEPLTSVNAQAYENIRTGLKTTARSFLKDDKAKALDKETSDMIRVREAAERVQEKVNALDQRIEQRGILMRLGRAAGGVIDVASGGLLRGFFQKLLLDSNRGNKSFNYLQIEENLKANLKRLQHIEKVNDSTLVRMIKEAGSYVNNSPNTPLRIPQTVFGRPQN